MPQDFRAYAMVDGELQDIMDNEGLIDTSYLDSISEDIVKDFDKLLDIEEQM